MKKFVLFTALLVFFLPSLANAGALDLLNSNLQTAVTGAASGLQTTAEKWLAVLCLFQMLFTGFGLLKSGADLQAAIGRLLGGLIWFGFAFYILQNAPAFLQSVVDGFFQIAGVISGTGSFNASDIIGSGTYMAGNLLAKINDATGITDVFLPAIIGGLVGVVILATATLIGFKIFLIKIESLLIIMLAPLSLAFFGLDAMKDQGFAPFKSVLSLLYRILLLALIVKTMSGMSDNLIAVINQITSDTIKGDNSIWSAVFAATIGYALLGFLAFKSDSIASSLASGGTSLGTGDVASAAAIGGAVGAAIMAGGGSAAASVVKSGMPSGIGGVVGNMMGGGSGSVSNGGSSGWVRPPEPRIDPLPPKSNSSLSSGSSSSGSSSTPGGSSAASARDPNKPLTFSQMAMKQFNPDPAPSSSSSQSAGNAADAGIGGNSGGGGGGTDAAGGDKLQKTLDGLLNQMSSPKQDSFGQRLKDLNQHVAQEKAATHVSINPHSGD